MPGPKTHILFDFFGTLVRYSASRIGQGHEALHRLVVEAGSEWGYRQFLDVWDAVGEDLERQASETLTEYSMDDMCRALLRRALRREPEAGLVHAVRDQYLDEWSTGVKYLPDVPDLLAELSRDFTLALVTNTHHAELVHGHLRRMDVGRYFAAVVTSVEYGKRKPDPAIFGHALTLTGGARHAAIYVGDSHAADYLGATSAHIDCLLIDPEGAHDIPSSSRIRRIAEVREACRRGW